MATIKKPAKKMQTGGKLVGYMGLGKAGNYAPTKKNLDKGFASRNMKSDDKNYKAKVKVGDDGTAKVTERRTVKGLLTGAPRAGGKMEIKKATFNVPEVKQQKKGGSVKKMGMGGMADSYTNYKMGGAVKAKNGKSFPDLNKDGKITKADILKGRGVIAKKGATLKKQAAVAIAMKKAGKAPKKMQYGGAAASMVPPMMKKGGATKKCKYGCK
jgi:hypothetical protein